MARLGPPPKPDEPRNPCWMYRLAKTDPELTADLLVAFDDPTWTHAALAARIAQVSQERPAGDSVGNHRHRKCPTCTEFGIVPAKVTET